MVTFGASNDFDLVASATPALGGLFFTTLITIFIHWLYFSLDERLTFLTVRLQPLVDFFTPLIIFFIGGALDIPYSVTPGGRSAG